MIDIKNSLNDENYSNTNLDDIKINICNRCLQFDKEILISILNFLKREHIDSKLFIQNSDGIRINLDKLNDTIIIKLFNFIEYKINEEKLKKNNY